MTVPILDPSALSGWLDPVDPKAPDRHTMRHGGDTPPSGSTTSADPYVADMDERPEDEDIIDPVDDTLRLLRGLLSLGIMPMSVSCGPDGVSVQVSQIKGPTSAESGEPEAPRSYIQRGLAGMRRVDK